MASSQVNNVEAKRVFVIGDLHGCSEEPATLLKHIETKEGLGDDDVLLFLGDYIDRGADSKGVIDLMLDYKRRFPKTRFLKGNHEDMMLDFLGFGGKLGQAFLYNGGIETLQSYGISVFSPPEQMVHALPPDHFRFLNELESIIKVGNFICVHAGLNPLRDLQAQNDGDVFWIRDDFINNIHSFQHTIVFGHTPHKEILMHLPYKVGLDTGLVFGNKLTCLELFEGRVFQIQKAKTEVIVGRIDLSQSFHAVAA